VADGLEAMARLPNPSPPGIMQKLHNDLHPVEALLVAVIVVFDAAVVLAVSLVALVLTVMRWRTTPRRSAQPAPPMVHPLTALAHTAVEVLQPCTVAQLRSMARSAGLPRALTRNGRRDALLEALAALEVVAYS
jgi:hypothetical protein